MTDDIREREALERAAGELTARLAREAGMEPLPSALAARLVAQGTAITSAAAPARVVTPLRTPSPARAWGLAALAAAAGFVLAVALRPASPVEPPASARVAALRDSLLAAARPLAWEATPDSAARGASGDVVWDGTRQAGVMRIRGLAPNDARRLQYQLWIFDAERDERYPVDGGVFDVPAEGGEVLVPVRARVPVGRAVLFAVTVEPPGGVVVSRRERIVLLAKAG
ncbi:MAG: anti-sigma factor [Gemmatimonadales bacterium]|nr:anti-sigma factor [Gemmatimonadales bacterium]